MLGRVNQRLIWRSQAHLAPSRSLATSCSLLLKRATASPDSSLGNPDSAHHDTLELQPIPNPPTFTASNSNTEERPEEWGDGRVDGSTKPFNTDMNLLLSMLLDNRVSPEVHHKWRRYVAGLQPQGNMKVFLLQMILREKTRIAKQRSMPYDEEVLSLLPIDSDWHQNLHEVIRQGYSQENLIQYRNVLIGKNDDDRCDSFVDSARPQPLFLLHFLLRRRSNFRNWETLVKLIDYCHKWYGDTVSWEAVSDKEETQLSQRELNYLRAMDTPNFSRLLDLLSYHCLRLEPRLIVKVAELAVHRIQTLPNTNQHPNKTFHAQCQLFNDALDALQPRMRRQAPETAFPNQYFWDSQRILLDMSSHLSRQLLVNKKGFRAIRNVLAGLSKNSTEKHNSFRQTENWPPYLRAVDGIDEEQEADEGWSRSVQAGAMMQEAGFSKEASDEALDTLQGLGSDGLPTIQQRSLIREGRRISPFEASIRATRNAQEAWMVFRNPPVDRADGQTIKPGPDEYATMFEKLSYRSRDDNSDSGTLPGDKALNFPSNNEHNLSVLEKVKLQPPSFAALYHDMRANKVALNQRCLRVLLKNANNIDSARSYLRYAINSRCVTPETSLLLDNPQYVELRQVEMGVFVSYIELCCSLREKNSKSKRGMLGRVVNLITKRMDVSVAHWTPLVWRPFLKTLEVPHYDLGIRLYEQWQLITHAIDRTEEFQIVPVSMFAKVCKILRLMMYREIKWMVDEMEGPRDAWVSSAEPSHLRTLAGSSLESLYFAKNQDEHSAKTRTTSTSRDSKTPLPTLQQVRRNGASLVKRLFKRLVEQERTVQEALGAHGILSLEKMATRRDPVAANHAHAYLLVLAYTGEFEEMLAATKWFIAEWVRADVSDELLQMEELPEYTHLSFPLCAYRLFAEPRLAPELSASLHEELEAGGLGWMWPNDKAVRDYGEGVSDEFNAHFRSALDEVESRFRARTSDDG